MSDIFLSYAHADFEWERRMFLALASNGWTVWWDVSVPAGALFDRTIERELAQLPRFPRETQGSRVCAWVFVTVLARPPAGSATRS
jgi:hypothetical protein